MKAALPVLLFLAVLSFSPIISFARPQENEPAPDPILIAFEKAKEAGHVADAGKLLSDAIRETEQRDTHSPKLAAYLDEFAILQHERGLFPEAIALRQRALEINREAYGPKDQSVEEDLREIGELYREQGKTGPAETFLRQALEVTHANPKISDMERFNVLDLLADIYADEHRWTEAEQMFLEVKQGCTEANKNYAPCGMLSEGLAKVYRNEGRVAESDELLSQGTFAPAEVERLDVQGQHYEENGQYVQAEDTYNTAIAWIEKNQPRLLLPLWLQFTRRGHAVEKQGRDEEAEKDYITAIEMEEQSASADGSGHPEYSAAVFNSLDFDDLLDICRAQKRLGDVEPVMRSAIELQEKLLGKQDPSLTHTLVALADLYQEEGVGHEAKYAEALPLYERALEIRQSAMGPDDPRLTDVLSPYADLLRKLHLDAKAAGVQARIDGLPDQTER